ncbi:MAG: prepilin-type N-terminal cleavage/methylation domain-containing protein [Planctomycetota bacterium]|nr:prepilin-type N-terminal cleavage/methylation domain-containing protein [Planctomycetota bacterium]
MRNKPAASAARRAGGFTLSELLVVLFVIMLLMTLGAPMLSKLLKSSRVMQTANTCLTVLFRARTEAMRYRLPVSVFYGDDLVRCPVQPTPGVLPPYGQIEIWTVKLDPPTAYGGNWYSDRSSHFINDGFNTRNYQPWNSGGNGGITFDTKERPLTPNPISFEDGTRILAGYFSYSASTRVFRTTNYLNNARGELKRHTTSFTGSGTSVNYGDAYGYRNLLVFDVSSGEHIIIEAAEFKAATRPRILMGPDAPLYLTHVGRRTSNGTSYAVTNFMQIPQDIDK